MVFCNSRTLPGQSYTFEEFFGVGVEAPHALRILLGERVQEVAREEQHIVRPLAERRDAAGARR